MNGGARLLLVAAAVPGPRQHERGGAARWPAFARRWDEAVWEGTQNLEDELMTSAIVYFERPEPGELLADYTPTIGPMSVRGALSILRLNERRAREALARSHGRKRGLGPKWPGRRGKEGKEGDVQE